MTAGTDTEWDLEVRAGKMSRWAIIAAAVLFAGHIGAALVLRSGGDSGVNLRIVDQIAILIIGVIVSGAVLLFTRPRLRVGPHGVSVRNVIVEKYVDWSEVRGLTFPYGAPWAHLELPHDEYVPVVAIQARDGGTAVTAVERFRELESRYCRGVGGAD
ncbi:PH domain-containing protein [Rhodococcus chondri]|uniref:PH domain-containing protein n=1 Tax=Rhodococcus chondri TaxID=3065941 RepID=A0ABU7JYT0_9NOCA|nr:PH domain-containing protein [Rhodococcus sp. CC-R104]MEE2035175.1 PH domain-containing protein [Rhodococcus sp. CC-R104]